MAGKGVNAGLGAVISYKQYKSGRFYEIEMTTAVGEAVAHLSAAHTAALDEIAEQAPKRRKSKIATAIAAARARVAADDEAAIFAASRVNTKIAVDRNLAVTAAIHKVNARTSAAHEAIMAEAAAICKSATREAIAAATAILAATYDAATVSAAEKASADKINAVLGAIDEACSGALADKGRLFAGPMAVAGEDIKHLTALVELDCASCPCAAPLPPSKVPPTSTLTLPVVAARSAQINDNSYKDDPEKNGNGYERGGGSPSGFKDLGGQLHADRNLNAKDNGTPHVGKNHDSKLNGDGIGTGDDNGNDNIDKNNRELAHYDDGRDKRGTGLREQGEKTKPSVGLWKKIFSFSKEAFTEYPQLFPVG